jgi:hypothetical protein
MIKITGREMGLIALGAFIPLMLGVVDAETAYWLRCMLSVLLIAWLLSKLNPFSGL